MPETYMDIKLQVLKEQYLLFFLLKLVYLDFHHL